MEGAVASDLMFWGRTWEKMQGGEGLLEEVGPTLQDPQTHPVGWAPTPTWGQVTGDSQHSSHAFITSVDYSEQFQVCGSVTLSHTVYKDAVDVGGCQAVGGCHRQTSRGRGAAGSGAGTQLAGLTLSVSSSSWRPGRPSHVGW